MEKTLKVLNALEQRGILGRYAIGGAMAAKEKRRHYLASRPYPEKVLMLLQLQRMAVPLLRKRNPRAQVWAI